MQSTNSPAFTLGNLIPAGVLQGGCCWKPFCLYEAPLQVSAWIKESSTASSTGLIGVYARVKRSDVLKWFSYSLKLIELTHRAIGETQTDSARGDTITLVNLPVFLLSLLQQIQLLFSSQICFRKKLWSCTNTIFWLLSICQCHLSEHASSVIWFGMMTLKVSHYTCSKYRQQGNCVLFCCYWASKTFYCSLLSSKDRKKNFLSMYGCVHMSVC